MDYDQKRSGVQPVLVSTLLFLVTLIGVMANASVLSVLMLMCLGAPALLLLADTLLGSATGRMQ